MFRQEVEEHWKSTYVIMKKVNAYGLAVQPGGQDAIYYYYVTVLVIVYVCAYTYF